MDSFVLTIVGVDRAGLVEALAEVVVSHGGTWERSQMTELAGMFAGMVLIHVPGERANAFEQALVPLRDQGLLDVTARPAVGIPSDDAPTVRIEVTGVDRAGIVHEVSSVLASSGVGIVDLRTWTESAPMAGGPLFRASALVRLSDGTTAGDLVALLEDLADDLLVDVDQA